MNRRDMVLEASLALLAVTLIVIGNFLVQRWWSASQTARVADAAADLGPVLDTQFVDRAADAEDFIPPKPLTNHSSSVKSARGMKRLEILIAEQLPKASPEERDVWRQQLQDLPLETAAGILETRRQLREHDLSPVEDLSSPTDSRLFHSGIIEFSR